MRDITFYIDENIRDVGNAGHVARFVSIFTHFGKVSIKDTYADDCLFFGRDKASVDNLIEEIKTIHSLKVLNPERSVFEYLGIEVNMEGDEVELLQLGLTEKACDRLGADLGQVVQNFHHLV